MFKFLFPHSCLSCGRGDKILCDSCVSDIKIRNYFEDKKVNAVCDYNEQSVKKIIHLYKYQYIGECADIFLFLLKKYMSNNIGIYDSVDALVPVPLFKYKYRKRGFNQSEQIAKMVSTIIDKPVDVSIIERIKNTKQQVGLSKKERKSNITGSMSIKNKNTLPKKVLLIDDVYTTGSTIDECAHKLNDAGVENIKVLVMAASKNI